MLFIRMGPRLLFLRSERIEDTKDFLLENLAGKETSFYSGMEEATEESSLLFLTGIVPSGKTAIEDAKTIVLVHQPASLCLSSIINCHVAHLLDRVDLGPSIMFLRIAGNEGKIVENLKNMYRGKVLPLEEAVREGERNDTILFLTQKQLSQQLSFKDVLDTYLLLPQPAAQISKKLRRDAILFITQNLEDRSWYELRINIYDSYGHYKEQYDRLIFVLSQLEVGMILEESWTRDHALVLFSVPAYQVRLFTLYEPEKIKEILLGLEYDEMGKRMVDFDLYYRNNKISWVHIARDNKSQNKLELVLQYRQKLLRELTPEAAERLLEMERQLKEKRGGRQGKERER